MGLPRVRHNWTTFTFTLEPSTLLKREFSLDNLTCSPTPQFSHSVVSDSATPWTGACQASLSITNSLSLLKLTFIELVMPSNHLILCCPLLLPPSIFPSIRVFSNESVLCQSLGGQSIGVSASALVLPMNIQNWFPLGLTGWTPSKLGKEYLKAVYCHPAYLTYM